TEKQRQKICAAAVQLMEHVHYVNAGTVEFLVENDHFYFIEVNPRVQVEHTITEMITDIDIVTTQILIAQGKDLHKEIGLPTQQELHFEGSAIQCRITTEDPLNNFLPDTGKIDTYRSDRKSTRLNSSHVSISYAVFCLKKKKDIQMKRRLRNTKGHEWEKRATSIGNLTDTDTGSVPLKANNQRKQIRPRDEASAYVRRT